MVIAIPGERGHTARRSHDADAADAPGDVIGARADDI
jgi:hypothetical protein